MEKEKILLSVVIPARNEGAVVPETVRSIFNVLKKESIPHEIIVVNDHSSDNTLSVLEDIKKEISTLKIIENTGKMGFGYTTIAGLKVFCGDYVAIMMADLSDNPDDLVVFLKKAISSGSDAVFGSRFIKGGKIYDYPVFKLILNRVVNNLIRILFITSYNDCTNAFKLYKKETILGLQPFISAHFNLTVELSIKTLIRGYSYEVVPNSWRNRKVGVSKLKINEMGSRYFFIIFYCLIERFFSLGDYKKKQL